MRPAGGLTDLAGLRVGHHTARGDGYLTGTTVVLAPPGGMVAGVDVRGGAPGTRETDLLAPQATVERVHALVLTGGSAFGLAAASGVADVLAASGIGFPVGADPLAVVPIVPAAVIFDLGRGGRFAARPDAQFGRLAAGAAGWDGAAESDGAAGSDGAEGVVGAGTGAVAGGLKGGIGQASTVLGDGTVVAALVVTNAAGSVYNPATGRLWASPLLRPEDGVTVDAPSAAERSALAALAVAERAALLARLRPPPVEGLPAASAGSGAGSEQQAASITHTTIGIVATDALLTKAQCQKLAAIAHDGLARAINPVHTTVDGDLFFGVSTAVGPAPDAAAFFELLGAAADLVSRAVARSVVGAESVSTPAGDWPSYLDLAPTVRRDERG